MRMLLHRGPGPMVYMPSQNKKDALRDRENPKTTEDGSMRQRTSQGSSRLRQLLVASMSGFAVLPVFFVPGPPCTLPSDVHNSGIINLRGWCCALSPPAPAPKYKES
uniref:Uncharacterized protein n=1 Tax=Eutreptiella gymnastica TaxID=73025 RepID=A0A7S4LKB8_9EUGL